MDLEVVQQQAAVLTSIAQAITEASQKPNRMAAVNQAVIFKYDLLRVKSSNKFYYKKRGTNTYELLDDHTLENIVRDVYLWGHINFTPKDLTDTVNMVKILNMNEVDEIKMNWVEITPNMYWNVQDGRIETKPSTPCFHRLFNTKYPDKHVVKVGPFSDENERLLMQSYDASLAYMNEHDGDLKEEFDFINVWANGVHDVYMDMIRAIGYCFLRKKPMGSYILIGLRRNGKSTFVGLLHTIFGRENTSMVRLSQLGDHHHNNAIVNTLLNAPDEEDEKAISAQADFKTIADHGRLTLTKMYSSDPVVVNCDFMSFYPMNHVPEWAGTGAAACTERSLVIPFYNDLSKYDRTSSNFAEETFTDETMAKLLGTVFAIATYYTSHDLAYSSTMQAERGVMEKDAESDIVYRKEFEKYFDGFQSIRLLYKDYRNWCNANDLTIMPRKHMSFVFKEYTVKQTSERVNNETVKMYRMPKSGLRPMLENDFYKELGASLSGIHDADKSVVERKTAYWEKAKEEFSGLGGTTNSSLEL